MRSQPDPRTELLSLWATMPAGDRHRLLSFAQPMVQQRPRQTCGQGKAAPTQATVRAIAASAQSPHQNFTSALAIAPPIAQTTIHTKLARAATTGPTEAPHYVAMTSAELRKECSKATPRIAWRNAHGKGKYLLKEEMVEALS